MCFVTSDVIDQESRSHRRSSRLGNWAPELSAPELMRAQSAARRAAISAQNSLTLTKRRGYRRYRVQAGDRFLDWPRWRAIYLDEYRTSGLNLTEVGVNDFPKYTGG